VLFSVLILLVGRDAIAFLMHDAAIRALAEAMLPFCAAIPTIGVAS